MDKRRIALVLVVGALVIAFFAAGGRDALSLQALQAHRDTFDSYRATHPWQAALLFAAGYIGVTALSLPGAAVMTLLAGALFGLLWGTVIVSFASTIGATLAFLLSRFVLRDWVHRRWRRTMRAVDRGMARDGALYLFGLRLVPVFPFFLINLLMGLTPMRTWVFYGVSQVGMLPGTLVYVNAGTQLGALESLRGILSPSLLGAFVVLAVFPWLARRLLRVVRSRVVLRGYRRPRRFDTNLVVLGAGSAGLVSALIAATVKARVTLVEKHRMGGDCLYTGCVPSKTLLRSAEVAQLARRGGEFGLNVDGVATNWPAVMDRVRRVIRTIEPHDSVERFTGLGVDCVQGEATITSPWTVSVNGRTITTRHIIVATGARPRVPPIPGLDTTDYRTSDTVWDLPALPSRLLVLGGGPVGCELAQAFARLGSAVTLVARSRLLPREDADAAAVVRGRLEAEGVRVCTGAEVTRFNRVDTAVEATVRDEEGRETPLACDEVLVATGRQANVSGLGLDALGVALREDGTVDVDEYLRTRIPTILACGDVTGPYQLTHSASHQAWYATVNALFGHIKSFAVDYRVLPWCTYTDPELARVGLNEQDAAQADTPVTVTRYELSGHDRALAEGETDGFVKVLTPPGKDRILGVTLVGPRAGELIAEWVLAMKHGIGLNKLLGTVHSYPTLAEANKFAAGEWKKAHKPERLLRWVARYHRWRRH